MPKIKFLSSKFMNLPDILVKLAKGLNINNSTIGFRYITFIYLKSESV